jgi:two-component system sensor histidine kinase HydH
MRDGGVNFATPPSSATASTPKALSGPGAPVPPGAPVGAGGGLGAGDLAELLRSFNDVTARLTGTHELLRDEVARLKAELARANEEIERSRRLAALGEMAAGIAHEVRNPLGSIGLHARILEQDLDGRPEQRELATRVLKAVRGIDAIVRDMLAFARETRLTPGATTAGELFGAALAEIGAQELGARGVGVEVEASSAGVGVVCDAGLVGRALINVVRNGVEAMTEHACVGRRPLLRLRARRDAGGEDGACGSGVGWVVLRIEDSGPGVSPEVIGRMFNPFYTTRATGTGLGLAIVHRIVDAHGGRVRVSNVEGTRKGERIGAVVELILPEAGPGGPT